VKKTLKHITSKQGRDSLLHFWVFLEMPLFAMSMGPFFNSPFEIFLYSIMLYFGLLYNVFVIGKIWRKKMI
jgi:hypothetical protein